MSEIHPIRFPEGVASPDGDVAFVELRTGGISAIDLRSGRDLWTIDLPARPVLVSGDRLIAEDRTQSQDNALQFALVDITRQGAIDRRIDPIVLPDWVSVSDPDRHFQYDAWMTDGRLVIDWRGESHYTGGAAPPPSVIAEAERAGRGRVRVDLETGSVEHDQIAEPAIVPANAVPPADIAGRLPPGAQATAVVGDRVFYLLEPSRPSAEGPKLVSLDLQTGNELWERTLPARATRVRARRM